MATMTAYYRTYDLPWNVPHEEKQRLRRLFAICFGITLLLSVIVPLLPVPERQVEQEQVVPPRFAKLVLERKVEPPPPPPPPPKVDPLPETRPTPQPQTQPQPQAPVDRVQEARQKAAQAGLLPFQEQLAALRDNTVIEKAGQTKNLIGTAGETTRAERSLITSKVGTGSGGINTANLSRGYGSGAGSLGGHETTQVSSTLAAGLPARDNVQRGGSGKASRSEEEIALVFDRNKGAIYSIYTRALRDNPNLQGKLVIELTISPEGEVTRCEIISSELNDPELERKLVARIKMFRFEPKDVGTITVTKPIDFFPA
jgi:protein TonB